MTELEKIAYAKSFIDKLANGINPIDDQPVAEYDVVNNVRLTRCFFYVSDILRQVIENGGITPPKKKAKSSFGITQEQLAQYPYSQLPISDYQVACDCGTQRACHLPLLFSPMLVRCAPYQ